MQYLKIKRNLTNDDFLSQFPKINFFKIKQESCKTTL